MSNKDVTNDHDVDDKRSPSTGSDTEAGGIPGDTNQDMPLDDHDFEKISPVLNLLEEARQYQLAGSFVKADPQASNGQLDGSPAGAIGLSPLMFEQAKQIGPFVIKEKIGQGGFGVVFRALDTRLDRDVALKIPRLAALLSDESRIRFAREATAAAALSHPNIVAIYESGSAGGVNYIACEFVLGSDLSTHVTATDIPTPVEAARLVAQLADAVEHAHRRGVLHRDLKPANILLEADSLTPRISDFGLASIMDDAQSQTDTGAALGTPAYMSPEQAIGDKSQLGPATDVYGLGSILYHLLCGQPPFQRSTVVDTVRAVAEDQPVAPRSLSQAVPPDLQAICLKCLEKRVADRYASAFELQRDLERFTQDLPVTARTIGPIERGLRWTKRNPVLAALSSAALIFLLTAVAATTAGWIVSSNALANVNAARVETKKALQEAESRYDDLKEAIDNYYRQVEENPELQKLPGGRDLRAKLLQSAVSYYQQFVQDNQGNPELAVDLAETRYRIGNIKFELGETGEARDELLAALQIVKPEYQQRPEDSDVKMLYAQVLKRLSQVHYNSGDVPKALESGLAGVEILRDLHQAQPQQAAPLKQLVKSLVSISSVFPAQNELEKQQQSLTEARAFCEQLIQLQNDDDTELLLLSITGSLGTAMRFAGRHQEAEQLTLEAQAGLQVFAENNPNNWEAQKNYVVASAQASMFSLMRNDVDTATPMLQAALAACQRLHQLFPDVAEFANLQMGVLQRIANCANLNKDTALEKRSLEEVVQISKELLDRDPNALESQVDYADNLTNLVVLRVKNALPLENAEALMAEAIGIFAHAVSVQSENYDFLLRFALALDARSQVAIQQDQVDTAVEFSDRAVGRLKEIAALGVTDPKVTYFSWTIFTHRGKVRTAAEMYSLARDDLQEALAVAPPPNHHETALLLSLAHLRVQEVAEAQTLFQGLPLEQFDDGKLELVARYHALLAANSAGAVQEKSTQAAIEILRQLARNNYFSDQSTFNRLQHHADFDGLRNDQAFGQAIANLQVRPQNE